MYINGMTIIYFKVSTHVYSSNDENTIRTQNKIRTQNTIRTQKCHVLRREKKNESSL